MSDPKVLKNHTYAVEYLLSGTADKSTGFSRHTETGAHNDPLASSAQLGLAFPASASASTEEIDEDNLRNYPAALSELNTLPFQLAAETWVTQKALSVSPKTTKFLNDNLRMLGRHFEGKKLAQISISEIEKYQQKRLKECENLDGLGIVSINHECGVLRQLLKRADVKRWENVIGPHYHELIKPRHLNVQVGQAMTPAMEKTLLEVFAQHIDRPFYTVAICASILSWRTTAGPGELKSLKLEDIDLNGQPRPTFTIPRRGAKRWTRERTLVLVGEDFGGALWAMRTLVDRARAFGCLRPEHYLIPFQIDRAHYDPTQPCTTWRRALDQMLNLADFPHKSRQMPNVASWRAYDFRHHAVTKLLENPRISLTTAIHLAGWISPGMIKKYSHARLEAMEEGALVLAGESGDSSKRQPETPVDKPVQPVKKCAARPVQAVKKIKPAHTPRPQHNRNHWLFATR